MAGPHPLGLDVLMIVRVARRGHRNPLRDGQATRLKLRDLVRIVGDQPHLADAKLSQNAAGRQEIALVHLEAERMVRVDGIETRILQRIGPHLVEKADVAPFLGQIDKNAASGLGHHFQRTFQLFAAIAFQAAENIAGDTLGMQSYKRRL